MLLTTEPADLPLDTPAADSVCRIYKMSSRTLPKFLCCCQNKDFRAFPIFVVHEVWALSIRDKCNYWTSLPDRRRFRASQRKKENKKTWDSKLWVDNQFDKYVPRAQSQWALRGTAHHLVSMIKIGQTGSEDVQPTPPVLITDGNDLRTKLYHTKQCWGKPASADQESRVTRNRKDG